MMKHSEGKAAMRVHIATFSGLPATNIQWPNKPFTVPTTGIWARVTFQGGDGFLAGLADNPLTRTTGMLTVQLFDRKNNGSAAVLLLADQLAAHLEYYGIGGLELIAASTIDVGDDGQGFYQVNINVPYRIN